MTLRNITVVCYSIRMRLLAGLVAFACIGIAADFDVLIRNARVVDGTGNAWFRADLGVKGGRIVELGRINGTKTGDRVIDAAGRVASPGFIDVHTHVEGDVEK